MTDETPTPPPLKTPLPEGMKSAMKDWRAGLRSMPKEYVWFHLQLARKARRELANKPGWQVHANRIISDGWMDGMRVLQLVVEAPNGALMKLKWNDDSQRFMRKAEYGHVYFSPDEVDWQVTQ